MHPSINYIKLTTIYHHHTCMNYYFLFITFSIKSIDDKMNEIFKSYHYNGQLSSEGNNIDDKMNGIYENRFSRWIKIYN